MTTTTAETDVPMSEQPLSTAEVKKPEEEKHVKEKKQKAPMKAKAISHPPYFQMIKEAIVALDEKSGSSPYAIGKYMEEKHKAELPANFRKILALQLKNSAAKGKLIKVKASYKLSVSGKEEKSLQAPKTRAATKANAEKKKPAAATETKKKKKKTRKMMKVPTGQKPSSEATKKVVGTKRTRKAVTAAKPKQPKSIKSPTVRKTKRARVSAI